MPNQSLVIIKKPSPVSINQTNVNNPVTEITRREKLTEITRVTETVNLADYKKDLNDLEARIYLNIDQLKNSLLTVISNAAISAATSHAYTWAPAERIDTLGQVTINGLLWPVNKGSSGQVLTTNGSNSMQWSTVSLSTAGGWTDSGSIVSLTDISDFVGIGTSTPATALDVNGEISVENQNAIRFYELQVNGSNYVAFFATSSMSSNLTYTWPGAEGSTGQVLTTNGNGNLFWSTLSLAAAGAGLMMGVLYV